MILTDDVRDQLDEDNILYGSAAYKNE